MIGREFLQRALPTAEFRGAWPATVGDFQIDTRKLASGDVFLALPGTRVDGHDFVAAAREAGAAAAVVARPVDDALPQLVVADVERALQTLAAGWRNEWQGQLLALTGSNGKTTTKEMTAAILTPLAPTCVTAGNLNNHLGVPLTLLRLRADQAFAVIEMGANHAGEIARYCAWARPDVSLITLAAAAHLEGFGSIEGVARAKGEIFAGLAVDGTAIINAADAYAPLWRELAGTRPVLDFGTDAAAVRADNLRTSAEATEFDLVIHGERLPLKLSAPGRHNVHNALAAAAAATALGVTPQQIVSGLQRFHPVAGRLHRIALDAGRVLWDDSYNANPGSVGAALDVLAEQQHPQLLCLGNMAELGAEAPALHGHVGQQAREQGIDALWTCGELAREASAAFGEGGRHFASAADMTRALLTEGRDFRSILIKGSRSAQMDTAVTALQREQAHA